MTDASSNVEIVDLHRLTKKIVPLLMCATVLLGGCATHRRPSIAWSTAILLKPVAPPAPPRPVTDPLEDAPDLQMELTPPPKLAVPRVNLPRPRLNAPSTVGPEMNSGDVLVLAPQLSAQETLDAQRETNQDVSVAEKNLSSARGRSLNPVQSDIASKVRGFIADAKDAARAGDWDRARSLAKKAQVLSQELVDSF